MAVTVADLTAPYNEICKKITQEFDLLNKLKNGINQCRPGEIPRHADSINKLFRRILSLHTQVSESAGRVDFAADYEKARTLHCEREIVNKYSAFVFAHGSMEMVLADVTKELARLAADPNPANRLDFKPRAPKAPTMFRRWANQASSTVSTVYKFTVQHPWAVAVTVTGAIAAGTRVACELADTLFPVQGLGESSSYSLLCPTAEMVTGGIAATAAAAAIVVTGIALKDPLSHVVQNTADAVRFAKAHPCTAGPTLICKLIRNAPQAAKAGYKASQYGGILGTLGAIGYAYFGGFQPKTFGAMVLSGFAAQAIYSGTQPQPPKPPRDPFAN